MKYTIKVEDEQGNVVSVKQGDEYLLITGTKQPNGELGGCACIRGSYNDLLRLYLGLGVSIHRYKENLPEHFEPETK